MTVQPAPCLCQCGKTFARPKSLPLCKSASQRAHRAFRASVQGTPNADYVRAFNAFYGSPEAVTAALAAA